MEKSSINTIENPIQWSPEDEKLSQILSQVLQNQVDELKLINPFITAAYNFAGEFASLLTQVENEQIFLLPVILNTFCLGIVVGTKLEQDK